MGLTVDLAKKTLANLAKSFAQRPWRCSKKRAGGAKVYLSLSSLLFNGLDVY